VPSAVYVPPHAPIQIPNTMCNWGGSLGVDRPRRQAKPCHLVPKLRLRRSTPLFPTWNVKVEQIRLSIWYPTDIASHNIDTKYSHKILKSSPSQSGSISHRFVLQAGIYFFIDVYMFVFLLNTVILCIFIVMSIYSYCIFMYLHRASWLSSATLTEAFPCFFLSCKANA